MDLIGLIEKERREKNRTKFSWIKYVQCLEKFFSKDLKNSLTIPVENFIIITDLIDDLMDKDKLETYCILKSNEHHLSLYLKKSLEKIESNVSSRKYRLFIDAISKSLSYQYYDSQYKLCADSNEQDYFKLVKKSVFLLQSIVFLITDTPPTIFLEAIECLAISGQIKNDLDELKKSIPYDILDSKGNFLSIKFIEWCQEQARHETEKRFLGINRKNFSIGQLNRIKNDIKESPVILYGQLSQKSFQNQARMKLKKINLEDFYDSLMR